MISQVNSASMRNAYTNNSGEQKVSQKGDSSISKQGDMSKIEQIKEALASGEYKVNLEALSQKIAEELM